MMGVLLLAGCVSFTTHVFRAEETATHLAYTAYMGWTNELATGTVSPEASNAVKQARLRFAASVQVVEAFRLEYITNVAAKPQLQAALEAMAGQSSNVVWLIGYWRAR